MNSNTSHVIVYQETEDRASTHTLYSNTSHVIVYRGRSMNAALTISNSNTSHVIVYLKMVSRGKGRKSIQIHLMLLFI